MYFSAPHKTHSHIIGSSGCCPLLQFYFRRTDINRLLEIPYGEYADTIQTETVQFEGFAERFCIICFTGTPNITLLPCFHLAFCRDCAIGLQVGYFFPFNLFFA
jgi:hypothetical protein